MKKNNSHLLDPFPHWRVLWKSGLTFIGVLAAFQTLARFSSLVESVRLWIFSEDWALLLLAVAFYALFLLAECILRNQRGDIEAVRSDPMEPRRKSVKAARKQRLENQKKQ